MWPRILIILSLIFIVVFFGWLGFRRIPYLQYLSSATPIENPVNPLVASAWKGPGFLEFLAKKPAKYQLSYCAPVKIVDSVAGIAAARLPFLRERMLSGLHAARTDSTLTFGYCKDDSTVVPWKTIVGLLSGEPGNWVVRFRILSNVGMDQTPGTYTARARTLEALDAAVSPVTTQIGQELSRLAAIKRDEGPMTNTFFTDERDDKSYPYVKIGSTTWMAKDLAYHSSGVICPDSADTICDRKGYLYKFEDALVACPIGWTLPSEEQWRELSEYIPRMDLAMIPTREGAPFVDRLAQGFAPRLHGIADGKTGKGQLETQAWWWSTKICKEDAHCAPYRKKYIVRLLDDMVVAWGINWDPSDSTVTNGWSRMLAWNQLGLAVRCVQSP